MSKHSMNYTQYIINGNPVHIEQLLSDKVFLRELTIILALPIAFVSLIFLLWALCGALIMDAIRISKHKIQRLSYVICVLRSLNAKVNLYHIKQLYSV